MVSAILCMLLISLGGISSPPLLSTFVEPSLVGFAFSPDGTGIIAATGEGIEWWSIATGQRTTFFPLQGIRAFSLAPAGDLFAVGFESAVEIWKTSSPSRMHVLPYGDITYRPYLAFSPSGRMLAAISGTRVVVWDVHTGRKVAVAGVEEFGVMLLDELVFLSDTELILSAFPEVVLWNFTTREKRALGKMAWRSKILADPKRRIVGYLVDSVGHSYRFLRVDTEETVLELQTTGGSDAWLGFLPTGQILAPAYITGAGMGLFVFDANSGEPKCCLTCARPTPIPNRAAVSQDGLKVAIHERPEEAVSHIAVYSLETCGPIAAVGKWSGQTQTVKPFWEGQHLARVSGNRVEIWDIAQGILLKELSVPAARALAVSPVSSWLAVGRGYGSEILLWNWKTGETRVIDLQLPDPQASFNNRAIVFVFSPDGQSLGVLHNDGTLSRWNWDAHKLLWRIDRAHKAINLAISPCGRILATVGAEIPLPQAGVLKLWDFDAGKLIDQVTGTYSAAEIFFLDEQHLLMSGETARPSAAWYVFSLEPDGKVRSVRMLRAPSGFGAVLSGGRTLAILQPKGETTPGVRLLLWDILEDKKIHHWELDFVRLSQYGSSVGFLAIPKTRDILLYDKSSSIRRYSLNLPPRAPQVLFDAESAIAGLEIRFCAQSEDPEGGPLTFVWEFEDGTTAQGACAAHRYATAGTYLLRVIATDDAGASASQEAAVEVLSDFTCRSEFTWSPAEPWVMEEVVFVDRSRPEEAITRRVWELGDGHYAEGLEVRHTYAAPGTYKVRLTAYCVDGKTQHVEATITVADVSYIEAIPSPVGPPFYKVRLAPADRAALSFGDVVQIVRRLARFDAEELLLVATGQVVLLEDTRAWISILNRVEGLEPKIGDRVLREERAMEKPQPGAAIAEEEPPPPKELAQLVCGEDVEDVRKRLGSSPDEDLAALMGGLSSPCTETRLDFIELVRELALAGMAEPLAPGLLPVFAKLLREDPEPLVRIRAIVALQEMPFVPEDVVPHLLAALRTDTDANVRAAAARILGRICFTKQYVTDEVMGVLHQALQDPDAIVRQEASSALARLPIKQEGDVASLIELLADPNPSTRAAAAFSLGHYKDKAVAAIPALLRLTEDPNAEVRYAAWGAINVIAKGTEEVRPYLIKGLSDPDERVRSVVIQVVKTLGVTDPEVVAGLVKLLESQSWGQRLNAAQALGYLRHFHGPINGEALQALLARASGDPHPLVRLEAVRALGKFAAGERAAMEGVINALGDEHPLVGLAAAGSLRGLKIPAEALVPLLRLMERILALDAPDWPSLEELMELPGRGEGIVIVIAPNRDEALSIIQDALKNIGAPTPQALSELVELLQARSAEVRLEAVKALVALGTEALPALDALMAATGDEDPRVRAEAEAAVTNLQKFVALALKPVQAEQDLGTRIVHALLAKLRDPVEPVVAAAARALGEMGAAVEEVVAALSTLKGHPSPFVRIAAEEALAKIQRPSFKELIFSPDPAVRAAAWQELQNLGFEETLPLIQSALQHPNWEARLSAVKALPTLPGNVEDILDILLQVLTNQNEVTAVRCAAGEAILDVDPSGEHSAKRMVEALLEIQRYDICISETLVRQGGKALEALLAILSEATSLKIGLAPLISAFGRDALDHLFQMAKKGVLTEDGLGTAALAIVEMPVPPIQEVISLLDSPEEDCRKLAVMTLSEWVQKKVQCVDWRWESEVCRSLTDLKPIITALGKMINDPSPKVRLEAVRALSSLARLPEAEVEVSVFLEALADRESSVRIIALQTLGTLGMKAREAAQALQALLEDPDPMIRILAARALGRMNVEVERAVEVLLESLFHESPGITEEAAWALGELGPAAEPAIPFLVMIWEAIPTQIIPTEPKVAWGPEILIKTAIVEALGKIGVRSPEVIQVLGEAAKHHWPFVRVAAAEALGMLGAEEDIEILSQLLKDPESFVREAAARALGNIGHPAAIDPLLEALKDHPSTAVALALAQFPEHGEKILPELIRALPDLPRWWEPGQTSPLCAFGDQAIVEVSNFLKTVRFKKEREAASYALEELRDCFGERAVPLLLEALRHPASDIRGTAIRALQDLGLSAVPRLIEGLKDPGLRSRVKDVLIDIGRDVFPYVIDLLRAEESEVRVAALEILVAVDISSALPFLFELLHDADPAVREAAVNGLAKAGPAAAPATPVLVSMLEDPALQVAVLATLEAIGPEAREAAPAVRALLNAPNFSARERAATVLAEMGADDKETIAALISALKDKHRFVVAAAQNALVKLAPASVPALVEAFFSDDPVLRAGAREALTKVPPDPLLLSLLQQQLVAESPHRLDTALLLSHFGPAGKDALSVLMETAVFHKDDVNIYQSVLAALGRLGPAAIPAVPLLLEGLDHESPMIRETAARALGQIFSAQRMSQP